MSTFNPFSGKTYTLASSISSTATSILLSSFKEPVTDTALTMALLNTDIVYATISPKTSNSEFISFTGITQNADGTATLTGVTRGLSKKSPFTSSASYKLAHAGQSTFIISDAPQVFNKYSVLENNETITGVKTFTSTAKAKYDTHPTFSSDTEIIDKKYADDTITGLVGTATETNAGTVEEATQAEVDAKTATGSVGRLFINPSKLRATNINDYVASDTGTANNYAIATNPVIVAYSQGQIFIFKAGNSSTGASTLNVCSLGTKSIVKNYSTAITTNDIKGGQVIMVGYDGTNFQMLGQIGTDPASIYELLSNKDTTTTLGTSDTKYPSQNAVKTYVDTQVSTYSLFKCGNTTKEMGDTSGTQTIAHGLGRIPKFVRLTATIKSATGYPITSISVYNGTTQSSISEGAGADVVTTFKLTYDDPLNKYQTGVITYDATNISIAWTKTSTPSGVYQILWEAFS